MLPMLVTETTTYSDLRPGLRLRFGYDTPVTNLKRLRDKRICILTPVSILKEDPNNPLNRPYYKYFVIVLRL